jgi:hypothetical protein
MMQTFRAHPVHVHLISNFGLKILTFSMLNRASYANSLVLYPYAFLLLHSLVHFRPVQISFPDFEDRELRRHFSLWRVSLTLTLSKAHHEYRDLENVIVFSRTSEKKFKKIVKRRIHAIIFLEDFVENFLGTRASRIDRNSDV